MSIVIVGGHSGDAEVMAGALIRKYVRHGHRVVLVGLTTGDGGHPTLSRPEYRLQKDAEATRAAQILGAECRLFPCSSGQLEISTAVQKDLAAIFEEVKPDVIITHWKDSVHRDHTASYYNTLLAMRLANMSTTPLFFAENWEDSVNYRPEIYVEVEQQDVDVWLQACNSFQFFRDNFYKFPYRQYYLNVFFNRGAEARLPLASTLMRHDYNGKFIEKEIPGIPLQ